MTEFAEPVEEYAVEVTWVDPVKAGAKDPTSQYGPMSRAQAEAFQRDMRSQRDIAATRLLNRRAMYTPWAGEETVPTTKEERDRLLQERWESINQVRKDET